MQKKLICSEFMTQLYDQFLLLLLLSFKEDKLEAHP